MLYFNCLRLALLSCRLCSFSIFFTFDKADNIIRGNNKDNITMHVIISYSFRFQSELHSMDITSKTLDFQTDIDRTDHYPFGKTGAYLSMYMGNNGIWINFLEAIASTCCLHYQVWRAH